MTDRDPSGDEPAEPAPDAPAASARRWARAQWDPGGEQDDEPAAPREPHAERTEPATEPAEEPDSTDEDTT